MHFNFSEKINVPDDYNNRNNDTYLKADDKSIGLLEFIHSETTKQEFDVWLANHSQFKFESGYPPCSYVVPTNIMQQVAYCGNYVLIEHICNIGGKHLLDLGNGSATPLSSAVQCMDEKRGLVVIKKLLELGANVNKSLFPSSSHTVLDQIIDREAPYHMGDCRFRRSYGDNGYKNHICFIVLNGGKTHSLSISHLPAGYPEPFKNAMLNKIMKPVYERLILLFKGRADPKSHISSLTRDDFRIVLDKCRLIDWHD
jgi:hypothetical protein